MKCPRDDILQGLAAKVNAHMVAGPPLGLSGYEFKATSLAMVSWAVLMLSPRIAW